MVVLLPLHLMYKQVAAECHNREQQGLVAYLLRRYALVFSKENHDLGKTTLSQHNIPWSQETEPFTCHHSGGVLKKKLKWSASYGASKRGGMIELAGRAWATPVVLVRKNHRNRQFKWRERFQIQFCTNVLNQAFLTVSHNRASIVLYESSLVLTVNLSYH